MTEPLPALSEMLALEAFRANGSLQRSLPGLAYSSDQVFERERQTLFARSWVFVGFAHQLAEPGDLVPVSVAGLPLLMVKTKQGETKLFHNVCRHRCAQLVRAPAQGASVIRCPYHFWVYGLDGRLRGTPHFGGPESQRPDGFDPAAHGLIPVRFAQWHDWIFANLDGQAPAFEDFAAPLIDQLGDLDLSRLTPLGEVDFGEVGCNWKYLMENFIEPYHVQFVHSSSTEQPLVDHRTIVDGPCLGSAVDLSPEQARSGATDSLAVSSRYLTLFPNFVLGYYAPDQLGVHLNVPLAADRTHQRRVIYSLTGERPEAETVEGLKTLWSQVHREDHEICERLQQAAPSPLARDGGLLSPHWEDSLRRFEELVVAALETPDSP